MPAPSQPAAVSGPGQYARRTDGGPAQKLRDLPDAQYGEAATYRQEQQAAPMAQTPNPSAGPSPTQYPTNPLASAVVPFSAPTQRPTEPVTSGAAFGPGAGPEALGINPDQVAAQDVTKLSAYLPILEFVANLPGSSPGARLAVNYLKANANVGSAQPSGQPAGQPPVQGAGGPGPAGPGQGPGPSV